MSVDMTPEEIKGGKKDTEGNLSESRVLII